ncbi:MAG: hypothetical protein FWE74_05840 [Oscillospiraceae bacterium]|nr:hypothetical protein [Oscillospiraceae bacterium]
MKNLITWMLLINRKEVSMASRIGAMFFLFLCAIVTIIIGATTGFALLVLIGIISAIIDGLVIAILVLVNILKNRPRW